MTPQAQSEIPPSRHEPHGVVGVWDPFVRFFHWALVLAVAGALVSGYLLGRSWLKLHLVSGAAIVILLAGRLVWGVLGSATARFAEFIVSPARTLQHARELFSGRAPRHLGHNPLGAWMIVALLLSLAALSLTGLMALGGFIKSGPLAFALSFDAGRAARGLHEILAIGLLVLIGAHLAGALFESLRSRENLVRAMFTGAKRAEPGMAPAATTASRPFAAAAIAVAVVAGGSLLVGYGNALPGRGVPQGRLDPLYVGECGSCHTPYHPSLAPAATWAGIMSGLANHFGENAQLDKAAGEAIALYLAENSAEHFDTLPAHLLRNVDSADPLRITSAPGWKRLHRKIGAEIFAAKAVGNSGACAACHADAPSGAFNPAMISIPAKATP